MKCNINRTINHNNMASVYGPEFNLNTEEIIDIIRKTAKLEMIDATFNPMNVEVTLYNNDYYVRPGADKTRFMKEFGKIFEDIKLRRDKIDDNLLYVGFTIQMLGIIKEFFDEAYFEEQVERRKHPAAVTVNKSKLKMYLKKLDRDKLELFLNTVVVCRRQHGLFITDIGSAGFWAKIHEACRAVGVNVPEDLDSIEGRTFLNNNPRFYFKALTSNVIANMLCDAIDLDIEMASSAAKRLYNSGYNAMINYINRKISLC